MSRGHDLKDGISLISIASPASHLQVLMSCEEKNEYSQTVPLYVLDEIFGYSYKDFIKKFLETASEDEKIESILAIRESIISVRKQWEAWGKDRGENQILYFTPIPGLKARLRVRFQGDAYSWEAEEDGSTHRDGILRRVLLSCIEDIKKDSRKGLEPAVFSFIHLLFSLPNVTEKRRVVLDCSLLTSMIKNTFGIKVNASKLAKDLSSGFLFGGSSGDVTLAEKMDVKNVHLQCTLSPKHIFTKDEAEEYEKRNGELTRCLLGSCSTSDKSRYASFDKVVGPKIYLRDDIGMYYPPTFVLRLFHYTSIRKIEGKIFGPYATNEWVTKHALPKFAIALMRLHSPELFSE